MKATISAILQEMKSYPEKREAIPEGEVIAQHQKVPNEEAAADTIRALEDRSGDHQLLMVFKYPQKRRIKGNVI